MSDGGSYDQRERFEDMEEMVRSAIEAARADMWTAVPVIFKKHDTDKNTVHAQPTIKLKHVKSDGSSEWKEFPLLKDVPIHYPAAGGASITMPIKDGDEGLMIFSARSIDKWWQQGGTQEQLHARMHDINDGFAIPGFRSQPRKLKNVNQSAIEMRTDEENPTQVFTFDPQAKTIAIKSPNPITFDAPSLRCTGEIIAKYDSDNIHLSTHVHPQPADSHGDTEQDTLKPKAGS